MDAIAYGICTVRMAFKYCTVILRMICISDFFENAHTNHWAGLSIDTGSIDTYL